jgi:hypothetical protein
LNLAGALDRRRDFSSGCDRQFGDRFERRRIANFDGLSVHLVAIRRA